MDMKGKIGPMSIQKPLAERLKSIESYFTDVEAKSEPIDSLAVKQAAKFFSRAGGIRLRSKEKVVQNMRLSTNSGCPYFTKRKNVVDEILSHKIVSNADKSAVWQIPNTQSYMKPSDKNMDNFRLAAVLGWRGQEGGISSDDVKQRVIWMMPFLLNAEELRFYQPAVEAIQSAGLIPAYVSMDAVDQEVTRLFDSKGNDDVVICTDFTKFDQHFNKDMQDAAHDIEWLLSTKDATCKDWFDNIYPIKFNLPIICDSNIMYSGYHGMGSGSGGTNFDECMAHKALQFEAALTAGQELNPHSMAYGDDGILTYPGINVEHVIQTYERHGQEMNASKQYVSKHDCVVLRRWHGMNYRVNGTMVGVYSTFRALGRLLAQERFYDPDKWSKDMVILRSLSIIENCKWSPYFKEFVDFVITGDKYRLGLDLPGFFDNLEQKAKEATEEFTDFLGYTKNLQKDVNNKEQESTGINDWEVVKYLKSKITSSTDKA
uniref:Putative RNA-dependent RNA polymerase n=1 Tax=Dromedary picobirnavirus TaxID=1574421 RepID=A0A0A1EJB7_9VIRU|nr:putative RNA-dependent RNA polymerase [Dromedary picobirnavirus]